MTNHLNVSEQKIEWIVISLSFFKIFTNEKHMTVKSSFTTVSR